MQKVITILVFSLLISCAKEKEYPKAGTWRATLLVQDNKELPFILEWNANNTMTIINAEERIEVSDITIDNDSITIAHPVFEGIFKGKLSNEKIAGYFIKPSLNRVVPFEMIYDNSIRFQKKTEPKEDVSGAWEMVFSAHSNEDRYIAKGIFKQDEQGKVTGTIRTTTGDYRFLEGVLDGTTLKLSTFDGAHAFLFEAEIKDSLLFGHFYSGNHWKEPFSGVRNESYELPDENKLTFLKEGYDRFDFSFPDAQGNIVSLNDEKYSGKVVVVQIMGTWCPNCLEETQYYTDYLKNNVSNDIEFVSLAFEYAPTKELALKGIKKLKDRVQVPYPILLAQYGSSSKQKANDKLPMLNHVLSYPTTIFIDKKGEVRKIHTGFNGKATGATYHKFVTEFESFLATLKAE